MTKSGFNFDLKFGLNSNLHLYIDYIEEENKTDPNAFCEFFYLKEAGDEYKKVVMILFYSKISAINV